MEVAAVDSVCVANGNGRKIEFVLVDNVVADDHVELEVTGSEVLAIYKLQPGMRLF